MSEEKKTARAQIFRYFCWCIYKTVPYKTFQNIKKGSKNSPKPVEFLDLDLLAPTELIYALKTQTGAIKDQRAKFETIIRMKIKGLMV